MTWHSNRQFDAETSKHPANFSVPVYTWLVSAIPPYPPHMSVTNSVTKSVTKHPADPRGLLPRLARSDHAPALNEHPQTRMYPASTATLCLPLLPFASWYAGVAQW